MGFLQDWAESDDLDGFDVLAAESVGADPIVTIPTVGANYTDAKTVTAVQAALVKRGYNIGTTGPNHDGVDGLFGSKTKSAIESLQQTVGAQVNGRIDETVIMALKVTPGVLPPGVTIQGRAALQAQVALEAATAAEHASSPADLQKAAQDAADAAAAAEPPVPPEVLQAARDAVTRSKQVTTPAQLQQVKQEVKQAAAVVAVQVAPNWWKQPAWPGGWERWKVVLTAGLGTAGLFGLLVWLLSGGKVKLPVKGP